VSGRPEREGRAARRGGPRTPGGDGAGPSAEAGPGFLLDLLAGKARAQAVSTAAALGLADRLAGGAKSAGELARELGCDQAALGTLLRFLVGVGVVESTQAGAFALTEAGAELRSDRLGALAAFLGSPEQWDPWSRLRDAVRDGGPTPFERVHGAALYDYLARDEPAARRYDRAIDAFTRHEAERLSAAFDFGAAQTVVDVGGGRGSLLLELLRRWPHLRGVLVDLPHVVERAAPRLAAEFAGRFEAVGEDFFASLPRGADVYLLKHVLHNWDDERAGALLARCAAAVRERGSVLVIDAVLMPDGRADVASMLDLEMLVLTGGRERRKPELRRLLHRAGLALDRIEPLTPMGWLFVASRRLA
jgi:hypothetical protein